MHDRRGDVVGRVLAAKLDVSDEELEQRREIGEVLVRLVGRLDRRVRPAPELIAIPALDAEQLGDHRHGERRRDRVDEVDLHARRYFGKHGSGDRADAILQRAHGPRREPAAHERTPRRVLWRIHVQHRSLHLHPAAHWIVQEHPASGTEAVRIATHRAHVVVAGDGP